RSISSASDAAALRISAASSLPAASDPSSLPQRASVAWCSSCRRRLTWRLNSMVADFQEDESEEGGVGEGTGEAGGRARVRKELPFEQDCGKQRGESAEVQRAMCGEQPHGRQRGDERRALLRARGVN